MNKTDLKQFTVRELKEIVKKKEQQEKYLKSWEPMLSRYLFKRFYKGSNHEWTDDWENPNANMSRYLKIAKEMLPKVRSHASWLNHSTIAYIIMATFDTLSLLEEE